mmetsp:Transcript_23975/g.26244  ORF Transcript_23975/g.26244 Transcript_23975/m.26244 type:complete len:256 (+) Transcript_23975:22-789(+)|eukprot:gene7834-8470_t
MMQGIARPHSLRVLTSVQQRPWILTSTASLKYNLNLPRPKHRPTVKKVQFITENLSTQEYGLQKIVYLANQRKGFVVVKRAIPSAEAKALAAKSGQTAVPKEEENLGFVYIPPTLKLQLPDANTLAVTYHRTEKNLYDTFLRHLDQVVKKPDQLYKKKLVLKGLGFRMSVEKNADGTGEKLSMKLGYSHLVEKDIPSYITSAKVKKNILILESYNKVLLGDFAASVQRVKPPEVYKEKGIYFAGEKVRLKPIKKK